MEQRVQIKKSGPLFDAAPEAFQQVSDEFVAEVAALLEATVRTFTPAGVYGNQGGLLAGIHGTVYNHGTPQVFGVVGHQSVYGDVREAGRKPGKMPPKGSLVRWIEVVLGADRKRAEALEFVIRRKIAQRGFDGAWMFAKAFETSEAKIAEIAEAKGLRIAFALGGGE